MKSLLVVLVVMVLGLAAIVAGWLVLRPTGQIAVDTVGVRLVMHDAWGRRVTVGPTTQPETVKADYYSPGQLDRTLERRVVGADGGESTETWQISSKGPWGLLSAIEVRSGQTTVLEFDNTLTARADVTIANNRMGEGDATPGTYAYLSLQITGGHEEEYSPIVLKNGKRARAPGFTILDGEDKEIYAGNFAYG